MSDTAMALAVSMAALSETSAERPVIPEDEVKNRVQEAITNVLKGLATGAETAVSSPVVAWLGRRRRCDRPDHRAVSGFRLTGLS
jgi:hypothetical protein